MNLNKTSDDPRRRITWRGKSLAICSKAELIECVLSLSSELVKVQKKPAIVQDSSTIIEESKKREG